MQSDSSLPSAVQAKRGSILIIDDDADILTVFKRSLEIAGYSTYGFINPVAAVEHFKQNPKAYPIVVTDVRMPGMSGFEVVREIRRINPDVKIIMTTAFEMTMREIKTVLPSLKINGIIEKPIELEKLNEIVRELEK